MQNGRFTSKIALHLKEICYKVCVNTVSNKVVMHSLAYLSVQKLFTGDVPFYVKIWLRLHELPPSKTPIFKFQSIFARSALAVRKKV